MASLPVNTTRLKYFDGAVIAPKKWFGENLNHDTKDLYCDGWILL